MNKKIFFIVLFVGLVIAVGVCIRFHAGFKYDKIENMETLFKGTNGLEKLRLTKTNLHEVFPSFEGKRTLQDELVYGDAVYIPQNYGKYHNALKWKRIMVPNMRFWGIKANVYCDFYNNKLVHLWANLQKGDFSIIQEKYGNGISFERYIDEHDIYIPYDIVHFFDCGYVGNSLHLYINGDVWMICNEDDEDPQIELFAKTPYFELLSNMNDAYTIKEGDEKYDSPKGRGSQDADDEEYWNSINREKALRNSGNDAAADLERRERLKYIQGGGYHSKDGGSQVHFQGSKEQEEQLRQMDEMGW